MAKVINLQGIRFGRLTAIRYIGGKHSSWVVQCDCGTEKTVQGGALRRENGTRSCGCLHMERCRSGANSTQHGDARKGKVKRLHNIWRNMLSKCEHGNCDRFPYYGGRGIKVCSEWHEYETFRDWAVNHGYTDMLTIHRVNNDGDYEPSNCMWADRKTQNRNTRQTRYVIVKGERMCLAECAEKYNIEYKKLQGRLNRGWEIERAVLDVKKVKNRIHLFKG